MEEPKPIHPVLRAARSQFSVFYGMATAEDVAWMDSLVLSHWAYRHGTSVSRALLPDGYRQTFERACDVAEQKFMLARDRVRECETFRRLVPGHQQRIAGVLFEICLPTE
jgi:hypothetical protein